jgi:Prokaryotic glutathione synthetase, ATP-grasp domain
MAPPGRENRFALCVIPDPLRAFDAPFWDSWIVGVFGVVNDPTAGRSLEFLRCNMSTPEIALVTASKMPKPDLDTGLLVEELGRIGVRAGIVSWDDPIPWGQAPLVVLRTPWDYSRRFGDFMEWARQVDGETRLLNPFPVLRWNGHKGYLLELEAKGVPVVPGALLRMSDPHALVSFSGFSAAAELVVKPAIGAGANGAMKARKEDPALERHLRGILKSTDALLQPFVPDVAESGEVSLVYFDGCYSHAIRKRPAKGDFRVQDQHGGTLHAHEPTSRELAVGSAALAVAPMPTAYARVDLVEWEGNPVIMELEFIEPELFLRRSPDGLRRFARGLKSALKGEGADREK